MFAWERVYPRKFEAVFRSGRRHSVQAQNPSVQSTAENLSCTVSLPEQKPASNFLSHLYPCRIMQITLLAHIESTWLINMTNLTYSSQCNSWRPGRIEHKKNSSHLCDEFPYSAIQLPAAISIWESSGFHSSVGCGSRRQYFVFAPHQAFTISFCILLLFYLHSHLAWELPGLPNKKDTVSGVSFYLAASYPPRPLPAKYFRRL